MKFFVFCMFVQDIQYMSCIYSINIYKFLLDLLHIILLNLSGTQNNSMNYHQSYVKTTFCSKVVKSIKCYRNLCKFLNFTESMEPLFVAGLRRVWWGLQPDGSVRLLWLHPLCQQLRSHLPYLFRWPTW